MRLPEPPRPWHLLLAPAVPIASLYSGHVDLIWPGAVVAPILAAGAVALVLWGALARLTGHSRAAALAVSILMLSGLGYAGLASAASRHFAHGVPITAAVVLGMPAMMLKVAWRRGDVLTRFANAALTIALVLVAVQVVTAERGGTPAAAPVGADQPASSARRPDVLMIVLDGYGRADQLKRHYGVERELSARLPALGFTVPGEAVANYSQTTHSLASSLNLDYLPALIGNDHGDAPGRHTLRWLIEQNRLFAAFASAGYRVTAYGSEYGNLRPGPVHRRPTLFGTPNEFDFAVYESTVVPTLLQIAGLPRADAPMRLHRRHIRWLLTELKQWAPQPGDPPQFTFAHLLAPHPPFAFNADGSSRATRLPALLGDGDHWHAIARGSGERYEDGYADSVAFLSREVEEVVRRVLANSTRPTLIYLQGDHGPGARLRWEDPDKSDLSDRFGILMALRLPDGRPAPLPSRTTPVNAMRVLLNEAVGTKLQRLDDRSYHATWDRPFELIDVSARIH